MAVSYTHLNPLSRPAQELNSTVHGKIYEVEKENVGVAVSYTHLDVYKRQLWGLP